MSKIKLLLDVVSDIRSLADSLQAVADVMMENEPTETAEPTTAKKDPMPKKSEKPKKKIQRENIARDKPPRSYLHRIGLIVSYGKISFTS